MLARTLDCVSSRTRVVCFVEFIQVKEGLLLHKAIMHRKHLRSSESACNIILASCRWVAVGGLPSC